MCKGENWRWCFEEGGEKKEKYRYEDIYIRYKNLKGDFRIWTSDVVSVGCGQSMGKKIGC